MKRRYRAVLMACVWVGIVATGAAWAADDVHSGYFTEHEPHKDLLDFDGLVLGQDRTAIDIPADFGKLINVTAGGLGVIFWFEDDQGRIRNVTLDPSPPLIIQRKGKLKSD